MIDKSIGQIAYEAAARLTKCNQPWSEANQLKWEDAAKAVHALAIKSPEAAAYQLNRAHDVGDKILNDPDRFPSLSKSVIPLADAVIRAYQRALKEAQSE